MDGRASLICVCDPGRDHCAQGETAHVLADLLFREGQSDTPVVPSTAYVALRAAVHDIVLFYG